MGKYSATAICAPSGESAEFVGNHFQLSERQRLAIMRSVASDQIRIKRKSKQLSLSELNGTNAY